MEVKEYCCDGCGKQTKAIGREETWLTVEGPCTLTIIARCSHASKFNRLDFCSIACLNEFMRKQGFDSRTFTACPVSEGLKGPYAVDLSVAGLDQCEDANEPTAPAQILSAKEWNKLLDTFGGIVQRHGRRRRE